MKGKLVVVYGDIVADRFVYGTPKRISREAPVLILRQYREDILLGGGGNAIHNLLSLGGVPKPVSVVGEDAAGAALLQSLSSRSSAAKRCASSSCASNWSSMSYRTICCRAACGKPPRMRTFVGVR